MAGIAELKDVVVFVAKLGNAGGKSLENSQIEFSDLFNFIPVVPAALSAFTGMSEIPSELSDLSDSEQAEVVALFKAELDLPQDEVEKAAELGFEVAMKLVKFFLSFKKAA